MFKVFYDSHLGGWDEEGYYVGLGKGDTGKEYETYEEAADVADKIDLAYKGFVSAMSLSGIAADTFPPLIVYAADEEEGARRKAEREEEDGDPGDTEEDAAGNYITYLEGVNGDGPETIKFAEDADRESAEARANAIADVLAEMKNRFTTTVYIVDESTGERIYSNTIAGTLIDPWRDRQDNDPGNP